MTLQPQQTDETDYPDYDGYRGQCHTYKSAIVLAALGMLLGAGVSAAEMHRRYEVAKHEREMREFWANNPPSGGFVGIPYPPPPPPVPATEE